MKLALIASFFLVVLMSQIGEMESASIFPFWPFFGFGSGQGSFINFDASLEVNKPDNDNQDHWHWHQDDCNDTRSGDDSSITEVKIPVSLINPMNIEMKEHPVSAWSIPMLHIPVAYFSGQKVEQPKPVVYVMNPAVFQNKVNKRKPKPNEEPAKEPTAQESIAQEAQQAQAPAPVSAQITIAQDKKNKV